TRVAGVGRVLVHVAPPGTVHHDPRHLHTVGSEEELRYLVVGRKARSPVREPRQANTVGVVGIVYAFQSVAAVEVPHVPEVGTDGVGKANALAGIARVCDASRRPLRAVLQLHLLARRETAAGEYHPAGDAKGAGARTVVEHDPGDGATIADECPGRGAASNLD